MLVGLSARAVGPTSAEVMAVSTSFVSIGVGLHGGLRHLRTTRSSTVPALRRTSPTRRRRPRCRRPARGLLRRPRSTTRAGSSSTSPPDCNRPHRRGGFVLSPTSDLGHQVAVSTLRPATDCDAAETFRVTSNSRSGASRDAATSSTVSPAPTVEQSQLAPVLVGGVAHREAEEQHRPPQAFVDAGNSVEPMTR